MLSVIVAILAGILLLADHFHGRGQGMVNTLRPFEVVIGVLALVFGVLGIMSLLGVALILAGLILGVSALQAIPSVGGELARASRALAPIRTLIGLAVLVLGVRALL